MSGLDRYLNSLASTSCNQGYLQASIDLDTLADHADLAGQKPEIVLALHGAAQTLRQQLKESIQK